MANKLNTLSKTNRWNYITYLLVIIAYVILQVMSSTGSISSSLKGMLVPICAYVVMAVSLNLTVGVLGELSLGHAGFMSVGAFTGVTAAVSLQNLIPSAPLRLAVSMVVAALFAALAGFLIGIPVLRLKGDYRPSSPWLSARSTRCIFNNLYVGLDESGFHFSPPERHHGPLRKRHPYHRRSHGHRRHPEDLHLHRRLYSGDDHPGRGVPPGEQPGRTGHHGYPG